MLLKCCLFSNGLLLWSSPLHHRNKVQEIHVAPHKGGRVVIVFDSNSIFEIRFFWAISRIFVFECSFRIRIEHLVNLATRKTEPLPSTALSR
jgi:hypothetical protein